jgi:hypothetical protein
MNWNKKKLQIQIQTYFFNPMIIREIYFPSNNLNP